MSQDPHKVLRISGDGLIHQRPALPDSSPEIERPLLALTGLSRNHELDAISARLMQSDDGHLNDACAVCALGIREHHFIVLGKGVFQILRHV